MGGTVSRLLGRARAAAERAADALDYVRGSYLAPPGFALLHPGLSLGPGVRFRGLPLIEIAPGAHIALGAGVMLNSRNRAYHLNMHSPVKLMADRPGAEIIIGAGARIHGSCVHAYQRIEIGAGTLVAANTQIIDGSGHSLSFPDVENRLHTRGDARPVFIGENVWIGTQCLILPGARIGEGAVIAAASVVVGEIPPRVLAGGNPARVLRDYSAEGEPPRPPAEPE